MALEARRRVDKQNPTVSQETAISVENVSKVYRLGVAETRHDTLGAVFVDMIKSPLENYKKYRSLYKFDDVTSTKIGNGTERSDVLWAVRDVSFDIKRGELVGLIGTNGAGKSTMLKILSRITPPTKGEVRVRGRVSSLLEVGTGFHPELTGRENVYLNGTILGMTKREVESKFDEIVEFSGVSKFLDTPVKRYSSGMKVRLAFAVAAHLEPEILIVDEVLAVGDAEFQKKCLRKMEDVGQHGRTVLFVSHNMSAIARLCERSILLHQGGIVKDGPTHEVVSAYLSSAWGQTAEREWPDEAEAPGDDVVKLRAVRVKDKNGEVSNSHDIRDPILIELDYDVMELHHQLYIHFLVHNQEGVCVFTAIDQDPEWRRKDRQTGRYTTVCRIPGNFLAEGTLSVTPVLRSIRPETYHGHAPDAIAFHVRESFEADSVRGDWVREIPGVVRPSLEWTTRYTCKG